MDRNLEFLFRTQAASAPTRQSGRQADEEVLGLTEILHFGTLSRRVQSK